MYLPPSYISLNGCVKHLCAVHSLRSMACYTFFMGHTANFAIEMDRVSNKASSWTQKCIDFSGVFVFEIGQKIKVLLQLFKGPGEVKQTITPTYIRVLAHSIKLTLYL